MINLHFRVQKTLFNDILFVFISRGCLKMFQILYIINVRARIYEFVCHCYFIFILLVFPFGTVFGVFLLCLKTNLAYFVNIHENIAFLLKKSLKYFVVWKKVRTFALAFEKYLSNETSGQD